MSEYPLLGARVANPFNHRIVVQAIRIENTVRKLRTKSGQRRHVGDVAGREQQRRFLAVKAGEFFLKQDMIMVGAGNIPGPARTGAATVDGRDHRVAHQGVLSHAKIIVRTPNGDIRQRIVFVPNRARETATFSLKISENPVSALSLQALDLVTEETVVIHCFGTFLPAKSQSSTNQ